MGTEEPPRGRFGSQLSRTGLGKTASRFGLGGGGPSNNTNNTPAASKKMPVQISEAFCATPKLTDGSSTTCRTSSPSPRGEGIAPSSSTGFWRRWQSQNRRTAGANFGTEKNNIDFGVLAPAEDEEEDEQAKRGTKLWREFDISPWVGGISSGGSSGAMSHHGRELQRRKCIFKVFVVFRGGWCSTSSVLLKGFVGLNASIKRAGGKIVAISSRSQHHTVLAAQDWKLPFQTYGDPSNQLITEMNRRFNMGCVVSTNEMVTETYPNGMAQPSVLVVYSDKAQNENSVLFKWSRYQTIGSLRHDDAWADILKALSMKTDPSSLSPPPSTPSTAISTPYAVPPRAPTPGGAAFRQPAALPGAPRGVGPSAASLSRDVSRLIESPAGETMTWGYAERSAERGNGTVTTGIRWPLRNGGGGGGGGTPSRDRGEGAGGGVAQSSVRPTRLPTPRRSVGGTKVFGASAAWPRQMPPLGGDPRDPPVQAQYPRQEQEHSRRDSHSGLTPKWGLGAEPPNTPRGSVNARGHHQTAQRTPRHSHGGHKQQQQQQPSGPQTPRRLWPFGSTGGTDSFADFEDDASCSPAGGGGPQTRRRGTDTGGAAAGDGQAVGRLWSASTRWNLGAKRGAPQAAPALPPPAFIEAGPIAPPPYSEGVGELTASR